MSLLLDWFVHPADNNDMGVMAGSWRCHRPLWLNRLSTTPVQSIVHPPAGAQRAGKNGSMSFLPTIAACKECSQWSQLDWFGHCWHRRRIRA